jgi:PAS domain S-box-containing protein
MLRPSFLDVSVVRRYVDAFSRHDLGTATDTVHADARFFPLSHFSGSPGASYHGRAGAHGLAKAILARLPELRVEPQALRTVNDRVLVTLSVIESPGEQSGTEVTDLYRVVDGRIVRAEAFASEAAAHEAAERPTEDEFEVLFRRAPVPVVMLDDDYRFLDANAAACALYALDSAGLRGRSILDFVPAELVGRIEKFLHASRGLGELTGEFGVVSHTGEHHPAVQFRASADIARGRHAAVLLAHDQQSRPGLHAPRLTPREREVFRLLAAGRSAVEIGERLRISRDTVRTHVRNGSVRLQAKTRVQAVALALALGEIALDVEPEG